MSENELNEIRQALLRIVKPEAIEPWLNRPNKSFDNQTPKQIIENGNVELIRQMIDQLESGKPS